MHETNLIRCNDCGHEVSKRADKCPHCGAPVDNELSQNERRKPTVVYNPRQDRFLTRNRGCFEIVFWLFLGIMLLAILRACIGG